MSRADALRLLGLQETATEEEIRKAYRRAAMRAHPDAGGTRLEWDRLRAAYQTLMGQAETQTEDLFLARLIARIAPSIDEGLGRVEDAAHRKIDTVLPRGFLGDLVRGAAHKLTQDLKDKAQEEIQKGLRNAARTTETK